MKTQAFLSPSLSLLLDLVRGIAALIVLVGHAQAMDLYTGPYPFGPYIQHHAVTVFFVLSGLVIAHSVSARSSDLGEYTIARFARIMPVVLLAIAVSILLYVLAEAAGLDSGASPPTDRLTWQTTLLPALFLSESAIGAGLVWNPPFWSLVCEVFFYALFGAAVFMRGKRRIIALAVIAALAGWKVLALFPIWLLGVALVICPERFAVSRVAGACALAISLAAMLLIDAHLVAWVFALSDFTGLSLETLGIAKYLLVDAAMGLTVMLCFIGLRAWADTLMPLLSRAERPIRWLAGISFTLYIVHHPMLLFVRANGIGAGDNTVFFAMLIGFVLAVSWLLADLVEHRTPRLRGVLRRWLAQRRLQAA